MYSSIEELKKLAGVNEWSGYSEYKLDENPSVTATALKAKEKKLGLKPGDAEWFKLWFSQPFLTGTPTFRGRKK
jgi:hypothetical protein